MRQRTITTSTLAAAGIALLVLLVAALLTGCAGKHQVTAPFSKSDGTEAGGWAVLASGPNGLTLRFVPKTSFGVGIVLRNRAKTPVTLVDVRTLAPAGSLVHQQGTQLLAWNPPPCNGHHSCPAFGFLRGPYRQAHPRPLAVNPGKQVAVQLDFRLASCADVPFASPGAAQRIELVYRVGGGQLQRQVLPLGGSRLNLRMPSRRDCMPRPRSTISVEGPYATGSGWTIPISSGDSCSRTRRGALLFTSRLYESPDKPAVRIEIRLPRLRGPGLYRTLARPAPALGPARVAAIVGIGIHGWETFRSSSADVTVKAITPETVKGRFRATIVALSGETFRTFGAWRCTLQ